MYHVDMSHADTARITIHLVDELICILTTKRQLGWMTGLSADYDARIFYIYVRPTGLCALRLLRVWPRLFCH